MIINWIVQKTHHKAQINQSIVSPISVASFPLIFTTDNCNVTIIRYLQDQREWKKHLGMNSQKSIQTCN